MSNEIGAELGGRTGPALSPDRVRSMFARVAPRYDLGNLLLTAGMDRRWRRYVQDKANLGPRERLLDLATGTGQLALDARRRQPSADIVAADLTPQMLELALRRPAARTIRWLQTDARFLPFSDGSFDVLTHGYLLRYLVDDLEAGLLEQWRVLKPGGRLVALETAPGRRGPGGSVARFLARRWPRIVGYLVAGDARDYGYLQDSTLAFLGPTNVAETLSGAGFVDVGHHAFLQGMVVVHWATKPQ